MEDEKQFSVDLPSLDSDDLETLPAESVLPASASSSASASNNGGWQKVVYPKRQRRQALNPAAPVPVANGHVEGSNVFASVDQKGQERRRAIELASAEAEVARSLAIVAAASDDENDDSGAEAAAGGEEGGEGGKKPKQKKVKKPKLTVAAASVKIDASHLDAYLADASAAFESQPHIQLSRLADYFGIAFAGVSASQFPWVKLLKESTVAKMVDIPLCHIEEPVYKVSVDWIGLRPPEALGNFIFWCLDTLLPDLANQQVAIKGSKNAGQSLSKNQVTIFVVLAMVLRRKPDALINFLPMLRENKYQGVDKLPLIIWTVAQAAQGDLVVGMYLWAQYLLPLMSEKSGNNPQSRDLILQLVERILSAPKAQPVLMNGAVRKGERLIPPTAFDQLMRSTFPAASLRVKATERFEAVYPFLKELALAGSTGTKTTKQASQQLLPLAMKAVQENNPEITKEAIDVLIWCLTQNSDCYRQWEKLYLENMAASVAVLEKLSVDWKQYSIQLAPLNTLRETLQHMRAKNVEALAGSDDADRIELVKDADKYCKVMLGRLTHGLGKCGAFFLVVAIALCALILAPNMEYMNIKKLSHMLSGSQSM